MSYTVLARKYRSSTFDEVVGQEQVAQTIKKAIESGRIAHAYLFCGTRGTGKTSTARILAKALNCESADKPTPVPCNKCASCLAITRGEDMDVIEIDAASNTGVDNIRDVIENSQYHPARSRFKVYIIDEVHMLSKPAFNALLKTLEEPPGHVKFILATTEPEKVLATILSRCQRYDFRSIPTRQIAGHLKEICKKEKIKADEESLLLVARAGAGSMRDALSLLERLLGAQETHLTAAIVESLLGLPKAQVIFDLAGAIGKGDVGKTLETADGLLRSGLAAESLPGALAEHLRNLLVLRTCGAKSELVEVPGLAAEALAQQAQLFDPAALAQDIVMLEELRRNMRQGQVGRALLDATLVRLALADQFASVAQLIERLGGADSEPAQKKKLEPMSPAPSPSPGTPGEGNGEGLARFAENQPPPQPSPGVPGEGEKEEEPAVGPTEAAADLPRAWRALLEELSEEASVASLLAYGQLVGIDDHRAVIRYPAGKDAMARMLDKNGKKDLIRTALSKVLRQDVGVRFEVDTLGAAASEPPPAPPQSGRLTAEARATAEADPLIQAVLRELGGTVVKVD